MPRHYHNPGNKNQLKLNFKINGFFDTETASPATAGVDLNSGVSYGKSAVASTIPYVRNVMNCFVDINNHPAYLRALFSIFISEIYILYTRDRCGSVY